MTKVKFYASQEFVSVRMDAVRLTWRERIKALVSGGAFVPVIVPNPTLVQLERGKFFGHPETIDAVKAEIGKLV